jgi:acetyltransferase-like isoleucine patch superfamily enzyme
VSGYSIGHWGRRVANALLRSEFVLVELRAEGLRKLGAQIGPNVVIHPGTRIVEPEHLEIGAETFVNSNCVLDCTGTIRIGRDVSFGFGVIVTTQDHDIGAPSHRCGDVRLEPVEIGDGTWLGAGVVVLPGVTIGAGAVVGAGSLVTKDLEPNRLYLGSPARPARDLAS